MAFDHVQILITGRVCGDATVLMKDGKPHLLFQVETHVWKRDATSQMTHTVLYEPVSDRQFNFLKEALVVGTPVLASGGMESLVLDSGQPSSYLITALTVQVDADVREARQAAKSRDVEEGTGRAERSAPAHAPTPRREYAQQSTSAPARSGSSSYGNRPASGRDDSYRQAPSGRDGHRPGTMQQRESVRPTSEPARPAASRPVLDFGLQAPPRPAPAPQRTTPAAPRPAPGPALDF